MSIVNLTAKAKWLRQEAFEATIRAGRGHLGGTFSCVDLLITLYYGGVLRIDPRNPLWPDRDRFILSKGHACLALYPILVDLGFMTRKRFLEYGNNGGSVGAQLDISIPGVEFNTGSLGHAPGIAAGMALAAKMDGRPFRAITIIGDSELFEGSVWEAIMFAGVHKLDNLIIVIDRNRLSVTDVIDDDSVFSNFEDKLRAFGWEYREINGHDFIDTFSAFADIAFSRQKPLMIVAHTIKGKGVSFMENGIGWHHGMPNEDQIKQARIELKS